MTKFVLVHGAWHGGWCWSDVERHLRARGHETHAPTLTGLGERSHLLDANIDPDLHVQDVVNTILWRELTEVVLVGHSYGGMIVTGVADRIPDRIEALAYLDAFVPEESGVSLFSKANPERMARFQEQIEQGAIAVEPDLIHVWTDNPEKQTWLREMCTPQPVGTLRSGVTLSGHEKKICRKCYIIAERNHPSAFWNEYEKVKLRPGWVSKRIGANHDAMIEEPVQLAELLHDFGRAR